MLNDYIDKNVSVGNDFNVCMDPKLDKKGGRQETISEYSKNISDCCEDLNVVDIWRTINPELNKYTWRGNT